MKNLRQWGLKHRVSAWPCNVLKKLLNSSIIYKYCISGSHLMATHFSERCTSWHCQKPKGPHAVVILKYVYYKYWRPGVNSSFKMINPRMWLCLIFRCDARQFYCSFILHNAFLTAQFSAAPAVLCFRQLLTFHYWILLELGYLKWTKRLPTPAKC